MKRKQKEFDYGKLNFKRKVNFGNRTNETNRNRKKTSLNSMEMSVNVNKLSFARVLLSIDDLEIHAAQIYL